MTVSELKALAAEKARKDQQLKARREVREATGKARAEKEADDRAREAREAGEGLRRENEEKILREKMIRDKRIG